MRRSDFNQPEVAGAASPRSVVDGDPRLPIQNIETFFEGMNVGRNRPVDRELIERQACMHRTMLRAHQPGLRVATTGIRVDDWRLELIFAGPNYCMHRRPLDND